MVINKNLNLIIFYFLAYLLFLPSVTFSIVPAEIFPWALIFTIIYIKKINKYLILIILLFILSIMYGIFLSEGRSFFESIRSFAAYMNGLLIFVFLLKVDYKFIAKLFPIIKGIFYILVILGILQMSGVIGFLDPVFKFLIPRGTAESLAFMGNRGITLFSSEPSRASYELIFIYIAFRTIFVKKNRLVYYDFFLLLFVLFIIKSGTGLILLIVFFVIFYKSKFILILSILTLIALPFIDYMSGRAMSILFDLLSSSSFNNLYNILLNLSGFRLISIIASFYYGILHPFGGGIGNWQESSILAFKLTNIDPSSINFFKYRGGGEFIPVRPSSYISSLFLDMGLIGVIMYFLFLFKICKKFISKYTINIFLYFLFYLIAVGAVGDPIPFITTAIALRFVENKKIRNKNDTN